jgi:hypothetical protein
MAKTTRTIEVEGGEYLDRATAERIDATCWAKDGDHELVERYPIEHRKFQGIVNLTPKDRVALRFGDWICQEQAGKRRIFVVSPEAFAARYAAADSAEAKAVAKRVADEAAATARKSERAAKALTVILALAAAICGDPGSVAFIAFGVTHLMYYSSLLGQWNGLANGVFDLDTDTVKVSAHTNTYAPNQDTHDFFDDVTNEVTGTNYTAGGATLTSPTVTRSTGTVTFDGADIVWTQSAGGFSTARKFVVYRSTGVSTTSRLFSVVTADADVGNVTGDLTIAWNASGIATWSTT